MHGARIVVTFVDVKTLNFSVAFVAVIAIAVEVAVYILAGGVRTARIVGTFVDVIADLAVARVAFPTLTLVRARSVRAVSKFRARCFIALVDIHAVVVGISNVACLTIALVRASVVDASFVRAAWVFTALIVVNAARVTITGVSSLTRASVGAFLVGAVGISSTRRNGSIALVDIRT